MMSNKFQNNLVSQGAIYSVGGKTDVKGKKEEADQLTIKWNALFMKK